MANVVADLVNWQCDAISGDWSEAEYDGAVVEISPAGQVHMTATGADQSRGLVQANIIPADEATFTIEIRLYVDNVGANANEGYRIECSNGTDKLGVTWRHAKVEVYDGAGWVEAGTDEMEEDKWIIWRIECTAGATVDIYKDDVLVKAGADCSWAAGDSRRPMFMLFGYTEATEIHMDYVKVGRGLGPFSDGGAVLQAII